MYIKIIESGCPVCGGEVRGSFKMKYLCKECNILFSYSDLSPEAKLKETISDGEKK